ncbi:hypothetical protein SAMN02927900_02989 [Rhizobium mongolense subsp. loessense]|uniref:Uncharacterized protein n=1 Tax=Rhizobium mongolense subsp. loessense TaxID=158890 RepID=A0A1G4RW31_9HYPH|nr:hypothetical protein [Rhizobium mongolense]SCW60299.1 hypothetical protein SAMN02927900_02989 [Rhizobium mongolense subsp. loessense]
MNTILITGCSSGFGLAGSFDEIRSSRSEETSEPMRSVIPISLAPKRH